MSLAWESELVELLASLSEVQGELLTLLSEKRQLLLDSDADGLAAIASREEELIARLEACQHHRRRLLEHAEEEGLPSANLEALSSALPNAARQRLDGPVRHAKARSRLLHHQSLASWVMIQRTLIHLSQMLEIIATRGRPDPIYRKGDAAAHNQGALVDHAV